VVRNINTVVTLRGDSLMNVGLIARPLPANAEGGVRQEPTVSGFMGGSLMSLRSFTPNDGIIRWNVGMANGTSANAGKTAKTRLPISDDDPKPIVKGYTKKAFCQTYPEFLTNQRSDVPATDRMKRGRRTQSVC